MSALLVLDASAAAVSVALIDVDSGVLLGSETRPMQRGQVEALLPMVDAVQRAAGIAYPDLVAIAATVGPGSFTGIRLGLAAARGIGLATGRPVFGIDSFAAQFVTLRADRSNLPETLLIVLDSKRQDLFAQALDAEGRALMPPQVLAPEAVRTLAEALLAERGGGLLLSGDAAQLPALAEIAAERVPCGPPAIAALAAHAAALWRASTVDGVALPAASPLYLRPPDAIVPTGGGVLPHLRPQG
ncbi:tRNA (adenosine(37)-N6)-threonylcarbamoyltransferase complex dimerization subunit type 1 TsaB [Elstera litoralis]|uniref:tRNA (adenosine(37)-N6)-threonylcarbamoyltransferase complex dimerization subunit type 1 TsaB n=1 Tax=Elstera litoralis TaxID=552518 RepID=UPI0006986AA3|nr:tRNA (adenosine(37)-N6)-threonylcarbamoyltransferase complex dimerization subunit type 1 TsaB [Elstera litoralis]